MTLDLSRRSVHWEGRTAAIDHTSGERIDYAGLDARADRAARRLAGLGVDPGDAVAVLSRNRPELLALFFGCRRVGATLAPVSHRLAPDTVRAVGGRIDPAVVLHEERFGELADAVPAGPITVEGFDDAPEAPPPDDPPETPPLYLHTGGTTGVPKVVVVGERQVEWNCVTEAAAWGLGKGTVSPVLLPTFHTGGWLLLTLPTLYVGGRVVLQRAFDPGAALAMIEAHAATQVFGVAAVFGAMADHPDFEGTDFSSVDWFMSGGGPTPPAVMDAYRERGETFVQGYGLTEGGPNNLYVDPAREDAHEAATESVGKPFPDCEIRIVDDDGTPIEPGTVGELEVAGPVTADRYLEREDGTFEGEWVSTGDLARRDGRGDVTIVGRTDNMFVSGGENVYPEAIEETLERHEAVEAAGVVPVDHERWGQVPKAVVVGGASAEDLETFAREHLADHQRPREWAFADDLPTSGPGKLDRTALREGYA